MESESPVVVTGAAGFIGFHLSKALLLKGVAVVGVDSVSSYYDPALKRARLGELVAFGELFSFVEEDIAAEEFGAIVEEHRPKVLVHLAAQAGVRYSIENPFAYVHSNLLGFTRVLEACRHHGVEHLLYASSSSVYGGNTKTPFSEEDRVDTPVSFYAATKRANELMAHSYSHLYGFAATGLRFFTVYGPWSRPDMVPFVFADAMKRGEPIRVFNNGDMQRDFTYIDDVVGAVLALFDAAPKDLQPAHRVVNVGRSSPTRLMDVIACLERELGIEAEKQMLPMQQGDVLSTNADVGRLRALTGFEPSVSIEEGMKRFVFWYEEYRGTNAG